MSLKGICVYAEGYSKFAPAPFGSSVGSCDMVLDVHLGLYTNPLKKTK